jgi:uncharacterized protein (TIGR03435 family)
MATNPTLFGNAKFLPVAFACILATCPAVAPGQSSVSSIAPAFTFTVATIKPSDPNRPTDQSSFGFNASGSFDARSLSLRQLIEFVFDMSYLDVDQRIVGGPRWLGSSKFDLSAKCDEETARAFGKMRPKEQLHAEQSMVQSLLADRFNLRMHHETRQLRVYALVPAEGGSKMEPAASPVLDELSGADGPPGNWKARGASMKALAGDISSLPEIGGKIVVDRTGLKGAFNFALRWTPDLAAGGTEPAPNIGAKPDAPAPSLLTALQEQLGLKLEWTRAPVDVIVIDSVGPPSAN